MTDSAWTTGCKLLFLELGRHPKWPKHRLNPGDPLGRCGQNEAGLVTDCAWPSGAKLGFLGLGFLG